MSTQRQLHHQSPIIFDFKLCLIPEGSDKQRIANWSAIPCQRKTASPLLWHIWKQSKHHPGMFIPVFAFTHELLDNIISYQSSVLWNLQNWYQYSYYQLFATSCKKNPETDRPLFHIEKQQKCKISNRWWMVSIRILVLTTWLHAGS